MKIFQKIMLTILGVVIVWIFWSSIDIAAYQKHHTKSFVTGEQSYLTDVVVKRGPISEKWVIDMIDAAKNRVWVSVYTFTLPVMRESLQRAQKRGVDVRVILEKFPFGNTTISRETESFLRENNIPLHQSGENQFVFMHAKFMIIDADWIVETANWTRASFSTNREFFIVGKDESILQNLTSIFESDFGGGIGFSGDVRLLAGPTNARERILYFLEEAQEEIDIYAPSFSDDTLIRELSELCMEGKEIRLLLASYDDGREKRQYGNCVQVRYMKKPLHAKVLIRDKKAVFVGSFNYTKNSLERNREVGLFLSGEVIKSISESFESDWKLSEVALR